jgi:hypothetical protein
MGRSKGERFLRVAPWAVWIGICGEFEIGREFEFQVYIQLTLKKILKKMKVWMKIGIFCE